MSNGQAVYFAWFRADARGFIFWPNGDPARLVPRDPPCPIAMEMGKGGIGQLSCSRPCSRPQNCIGWRGRRFAQACDSAWKARRERGSWSAILLAHRPTCSPQGGRTVSRRTRAL